MLARSVYQQLTVNIWSFLTTAICYQETYQQLTAINIWWLQERDQINRSLRPEFFYLKQERERREKMLD